MFQMLRTNFYMQRLPHYLLEHVRGYVFTCLYSDFSAVGLLCGLPGDLPSSTDHEQLVAQ